MPRWATITAMPFLKFKGVERPVLLDCPEDTIQELPKWLTPVKTSLKVFGNVSG